MVLGWGSKGFQRHKAFHEVKGMGHAPRGVQRDPRSGSLNASYRKEQYIWLRGGDLNLFVLRFYGPVNPMGILMVSEI